MNGNRGLAVAFLVGFVVRLVPELVSFPFHIGWDTIFYAYRVSEGVVWGYWDSFFSTWLPYGVMVVMGDVVGWDPFLVLKLVAPLLFGGCAAGVYFVAWKRLGWRVEKSLLASVFFSFQVAALAISWQFYRNMFGVMFLLFALPFVKEEMEWREVVWLGGLGLLVVLSHELAAVSFFFVVFALVGWGFVRRGRVSYQLLVAVLPGLVVFLVNNFGFHPFGGLQRNIMWLGDSDYAHVGGLYFLTDYLRVSTPFEHYSGYLDLFFHVSSLFILLYALILPLVLVGYFRDKALVFWTGILGVGALGCLILPSSALLLWNRWMLMLVFPLTFFAVHGLWKALKQGSISLSSPFSWFRIPRKIALGLVMSFVLAGALFMVLPPGERHDPVGWGNTFPYIPSSMQRSSIPLEDTPHVNEAYRWLNTHMDDRSCLLSPYVFEFWTLLRLEEEHSALIFHQDLEKATSTALQNGYQTVYLLWWNPEMEWYHLQIPPDWIPIFHSDRITIYKYTEL
ncbi:MAG: hypothetical protein ACOC6H_01015 [Thermoproteota archaeon]